MIPSPCHFSNQGGKGSSSPRSWKSIDHGPHMAVYDPIPSTSLRPYSREVSTSNMTFGSAAGRCIASLLLRRDLEQCQGLPAPTTGQQVTAVRGAWAINDGKTPDLAGPWVHGGRPPIVALQLAHGGPAVGRQGHTFAANIRNALISRVEHEQQVPPVPLAGKEKPRR